MPEQELPGDVLVQPCRARCAGGDHSVSRSTLRSRAVHDVQVVVTRSVRSRRVLAVSFRVFFPFGRVTVHTDCVQGSELPLEVVPQRTFIADAGPFVTLVTWSVAEACQYICSSTKSMPTVSKFSETVLTSN